MTRAIVHMDLDTFFVSCERLVNSALSSLPLIIGGSADRGVVAACSYEARRFGVRSAMPMGLALRLCPDAKVIRGDMELYSRCSRLVTEIIAEKAPLVEKASIDEFYLDVSGMDRFFGCYRWTEELAGRITSESGLPVSFALSVNKTVSKIATGEAKPLGRMQVQEPMVRSFLDPLPVRRIPMVGDSTGRLLSRIGIRRIGTLAQVPAEMLQRLLGKNGTELWKKANGVDNSPVVPYHERKSISTEQTFERDTIDIPMLHSLLAAMAEKLAFQLRREGWLASVVTVRIRYSNFDTHSSQCHIASTSCDHTLLQKARELFDKLYRRRMRLRLVGVRLGGLVRGSCQINLFEDTGGMVALCQAMDRMRLRFGYDSIRRGGSLPAQSPSPTARIIYSFSILLAAVAPL